MHAYGVVRLADGGEVERIAWVILATVIALVTGMGVLALLMGITLTQDITRHMLGIDPA